MRTSLIPPLCIITAMMLLAISDNFIWMIADKMSVWQYHAVRAAMILPLMFVVIAVVGQAGSIRVKRPAPVAARAFFTVSALMLYFAAIPAVGVSLAAAGLFTSPIFVVLVSMVIFREHVGWQRIAGVALGFLGVCLVLEIATQPLRAMAVAPMLGGLLYGLNVIWTRRYCREETPGALAFWNMFAFLLLGGAGMLAAPLMAGLIGHVEGTEFATMAVQVPTTEELAIVAAMGVAGATGMVLLAKGYASAPSTYAALFDYSFLFWVPFFAWLLRGELLNGSIATGMGLIILAGALGAQGSSATELSEAEPVTK
ncbi:MAG: DMT family transporter [Pseudomonadota bacterium]